MIGQVFWRYAPPAPPVKKAAKPTGCADRWLALSERAGFPIPRGAAAGGGAAAAAPEEADESFPTTPFPLEEFAVIVNLARFLTTAEYGNLRAVSKAVKNSLDTFAQIESYTIHTQSSIPLPNLGFVKHLTIIERGSAQTPSAERIAVVKAALSTATRLETLTCDLSTFDPYMEEIIQYIGLKKLKIISAMSLQSITANLHLFQQLKKLKYLGTSYVLNDMNAFIQAAARLPRLVSFEIACQAAAAFDLSPLTQSRTLKSLSIPCQGDSILEIMLLPLNKLCISNYTTIKSAAEPQPFPDLHSVPKNPFIKEFTLQFPRYCIHKNQRQIFTSDLVRHFPNLEGLSLPGNDDYEFRKFTSWPWEGLKGLKRLDVGSTTINEDYIDSFFDSLPAGLEQFHYHGMRSVSVAPLLRNLPRFNLWSLGLNGNRLDDPVGLAKALVKYAPELEILGFTIYNINFKNVKDTFAELSELKYLHHIYMYNEGHCFTMIRDDEFSFLRTLFKNKGTVLVSKRALSTHQKKKGIIAN